MLPVLNGLVILQKSLLEAVYNTVYWPLFNVKVEVMRDSQFIHQKSSQFHLNKTCTALITFHIKYLTPFSLYYTTPLGTSKHSKR